MRHTAVDSTAARLSATSGHSGCTGEPLGARLGAGTRSNGNRWTVGLGIRQSLKIPHSRANFKRRANGVQTAQPLAKAASLADIHWRTELLCQDVSESTGGVKAADFVALVRCHDIESVRAERPDRDRPSPPRQRDGRPRPVRFPRFALAIGHG